MRLLLQLDHGGGSRRPLQISLAGDATVGELADHLSGLCGLPPGATIEGFGRDELVLDVGPRSGSTVRLVPPKPLRRPPMAAPVEAAFPVGASGESRDPKPLCYGTNDIGGAVLKVTDLVEVRSDGNSTIYVNGERVLGSRRLSSGDIVSTGSATASATSFVLRVTGRLRNPSDAGPTLAHPIARRHHPSYQPVELDLPTPPDRVRLPGFPVLSAVVPLLMGAGLWLATRSIASSVFIIFSFVYVIASGLEARREARSEERFREAQFSSDLSEVEERVAQLHAAERSTLSKRCPEANEITSIAMTASDRLWERRTDDPGASPLAVRVGTARTSASLRLQVPRSGRRDLREKATKVASEASHTKLPLVVDLDLGGGLALVGPDEATTDVARWIVTQLATLVAPDDLRIVVICDPSRACVWEWSSWLPHVQSDAAAPRTVVLVDGAADGIVQSALESITDGSARMLWLTPTRAGVPDFLRQVLELDTSPQLVAASVSTRNEPELHGSPSGSELLPVPMADFELEDMSEDQVLPLARQLAPLVPRRSQLDAPRNTSGSTGHFGLGDLLNDPELLRCQEAVQHRWEQSSQQLGLAAAVGRTNGGTVGLDLISDGPHALVAGTTGSGKSEFLRLMISSLALSHSPERLTFLLVDYKGGAAFNTLDQLPHSVGMITDLNPELAERALMSLRAEVIRRERLLADLGAVDLERALLTTIRDNAGGSSPGKVPPSLVVVVDEFATLARDLPGFVDGLVDIAQRGRSLGIHLVLATQRPAGVVTDSIRANTSLRIALRMADPDDSSDVVDTPDAVELPRSSPGRALVRIGASTAVQVQFAHASGPSFTPLRVTSQVLGPGPIASRALGVHPDASNAAPVWEADLGVSELELAVSIAKSAARKGGFAEPRRPWVPPLPTKISLGDIPDHLTVEQDHPLPVIGLVDRPSLQRTDGLVLDLPTQGGVLVIGASGSGKSSTLSTIAGVCGMPAYLIGNVAYPADTGRLQTGDATSGSPYSDTIETVDVERSLRLLRGAAARLSLPEVTGVPPREMLILVDDLAAFEEVHESVNRGEALDLLNRISREGRTRGVHLAISAHRRIEVPPSLTAGLGMQILLRCSSEDEAAMLGLDADAASRDRPPGRGYVDGELVQVGVSAQGPFPHADEQGAGGEKIRSLPLRVDLADLNFAPQSAADQTAGRGLAEMSSPTSPWGSLPIGIHGDDLSEVRLDLEHSHLVVAGRRRSGRSSTLRLLAMTLAATSAEMIQNGPGTLEARHPIVGASAFLMSPRAVAPGDCWTATLGPVPQGSPNATSAIASFLSQVAQSARSGVHTMLAVDDLPDLLDSRFGGEVESGLFELLTLAEEAPLRLIVSGEIEAISRCFSETLTRIRAGRTAILIQPDADVHGSIAHRSIPRRDELESVPGRGWLIQDDRPVPVQLACP